MSGSSDPAVAVDARGNATAVWVHFDCRRTTLWSSRFSASRD